MCASVRVIACLMAEGFSCAQYVARRIKLSAILLAVLVSSTAVAQEKSVLDEEEVILQEARAAEGGSNSDLAKAAQNPIANLISLPFQNNTDFDWGPEEGTRNVLNIQPVWPFEMTDNWNVITRTIMPIVSQPGLVPGQSRETGLGDITFTAFFSPPAAADLTWGVGPVVLLPTATDDRLGSDSWGLGPSVVLLITPGKWVVGSLFSQVWDVAGSGDDISLFTWQPFINYNIKDGLYLTTAPIITANWEASSGDEWTIPLGGGIGKVFRIGKLPLNTSAQLYYNIDSPTFVGDWQMRLQVQLMFPKK